MHAETYPRLANKTIELYYILFCIKSEIYIYTEKYTVRYFPYLHYSEDIDHVTFSNLLLSVKFHNFLLGTI
jgi:hypothetical protein